VRTIRLSSRYIRDLKRESKGQNRKLLETKLPQVVSLLANDQPLEASWCDHPLIGEWTGYRDCHIKPDLVLIYRKPDDNTLELTRLGSHDEVSL
jgi:mRNA interferase YafQ